MSDKGKIRKYHSLVLADKVLAELRRHWPKSWEGVVRCYANGREQGHHLEACVPGDHFPRAACVFSEARGTDGVLVVAGPADRFRQMDMHPMPDLWRDTENSRKYFHDTDGPGGKLVEGRAIKQAAKWIIKRLRELLTEDLKRRQERDKAPRPWAGIC
jgi:hypothetical protein